jgi:hypothetical protein
MNAKLLIRCEAELLLQPCSTTMIQTKKMPAAPLAQIFRSISVPANSRYTWILGW